MKRKTARATAGLLRCLAGGGGGGSGGAGDGAAAALLRRLDLYDARPLRAAHPRLAAAVGAADWGWNGAWSRDVMTLDWRAARAATVTAAANLAAALPHAACCLELELNPCVGTLAAAAMAVAATAVIPALPPSLAAVRLLCNIRLPEAAAFVTALCRHLRALREFNTKFAALSAAALAALPPTLCRLRLTHAVLPPRGVRLGHLVALTALDVAHCVEWDDAALASLSPTLVRLDVARTGLTDAARFDHLRSLRALNVHDTHVSDGALASMPRGLTRLCASYARLTHAARFSHLPHLRSLNVSCTNVGDAAFASVPPSVHTVRAFYTSLSDAASFDHLPRLRVLDARYTGAYNAGHVPAPAAA